MNTLTLIKKQIDKAAALHDAQINITKYRGVDCAVKTSKRKLTAPSAIVVAPTPSEATMEALQITGVITLGCFSAMSLLYGEIIFLRHS